MDNSGNSDGLIEDMARLGADIEDAMHRFMDNTALYEKMLKKLPEVLEKAPVLEYFESGDFDAALSNAHTIKGVVGNLSLTPLHNDYTEIVELCREGELSKAHKIAVKTVKLQEEIVRQIKKYM